jgi:hypothetical protein
VAQSIFKKTINIEAEGRLERMKGNIRKIMEEEERIKEEVEEQRKQIKEKVKETNKNYREKREKSKEYK